MKRSMKTVSTVSLAGVVLMFVAAHVTAQSPGAMGQGRGMGMRGGMMMEHMKMIVPTPLR
jgi:Spy/CpxP family protein refolding chaperone